jgi:hypothetical protein
MEGDIIRKLKMRLSRSVGEAAGDEAAEWASGCGAMRGGRYRQKHFERGALAGVAFDLDAPLVCADHGLNHAQSEAEPALRAALFPAEKAVKYPWQVLSRNADAVISYQDRHVGLAQDRFDDNRTAAGSEFDRIVHQVGNHLPNSV